MSSYRLALRLGAVDTDTTQFYFQQLRLDVQLQKRCIIEHNYTQIILPHSIISLDQYDQDWCRPALISIRLHMA